jgi:hypothetical protein
MSPVTNAIKEVVLSGSSFAAINLFGPRHDVVGKPGRQSPELVWFR